MQKPGGAGLLGECTGGHTCPALYLHGCGLLMGGCMKGLDLDLDLGFLCTLPDW